MEKQVSHRSFLNNVIELKDNALSGVKSLFTSTSHARIMPEIKRVSTVAVMDAGLVGDSKTCAQKLKAEEAMAEVQRLKQFRSPLTVIFHYYSKSTAKPV